MNTDGFYSWALDKFLNTSAVDHPSIKWFNKCIYSAMSKPEHDRKANPLIVGICGNAGTGKDTAVRYMLDPKTMTDIGKISYRMAFADPIREIAAIFGFTKEQMSDRKLKETEDPFWGFSPRTFMQKVGTEMFRDNLREDVWIQLLVRRINEKIAENEKQDFHKGIYFITDVRFPNEAQAIKNIGGYVVKIHRDGYSKSGENLHPSEKFVEQIEADLIIENKASNADEWSFDFTRQLFQFLKHDAFYWN